MGRLVLPENTSPELHPPDLRPTRPEAEGLEGDLHLDGPPPVEAAGPNVPDRVPVGVGGPFIGDLGVHEATNRVDREGDTVAPVVEGVERHAEPVVLDDLERIALHLVGDPPGLRRRVPEARTDIDVPRVIEDPCLGFFRGRLASVRQLLDEAADRRHLAVDPLVQCSVQPPGSGQADRPNGRASRRIATVLADAVRTTRRADSRTGDAHPETVDRRRNDLGARLMRRNRPKSRRPACVRPYNRLPVLPQSKEGLGAAACIGVLGTYAVTAKISEGGMWPVEVRPVRP